MDLQDQLIKLGEKNKSLRPYIRPVLAVLKQASRPYTGYSVSELKRMLWDAASQSGVDGTYMDNLIHDLRAHGVSEHAIDAIIRQSSPGKSFPSRLDHSAAITSSRPLLDAEVESMGIMLRYPENFAPYTEAQHLERDGDKEKALRLLPTLIDALKKRDRQTARRVYDRLPKAYKYSISNVVLQFILDGVVASRRGSRYSIGFEVEFPSLQTLRRYIDLHSDTYDDLEEVEMERLRDTIENIVSRDVLGRSVPSPRRGNRAFIISVPVDGVDAEAEIVLAEKKVEGGIDMVGRLLDSHLAREMKIIDHWLY